MPVTVDPEPPALPELLDAGDLARCFGVSTRTIREWIKAGTIPQPVRLGRRPVWAPEAIRRFLSGEVPAR